LGFTGLPIAARFAESNVSANCFNPSQPPFMLNFNASHFILNFALSQHNLDTSQHTE
jgi:hypothetical protein